MRETLRQLFRDVRSQKLRTSLTIFGIVWGTVAISLMLAFGTGLHKQLIKSTAGLGDRIVIFDRNPGRIRAVVRAARPPPRSSRGSGDPSP